jgi:hypothetical protein
MHGAFIVELPLQFDGMTLQVKVENVFLVNDFGCFSGWQLAMLNFENVTPAISGIGKHGFIVQPAR